MGSCPDTDIDPNIDCEFTPNEDVSEEYFRAFGGGGQVNFIGTQRKSSPPFPPSSRCK